MHGSKLVVRSLMAIAVALGGLGTWADTATAKPVGAHDDELLREAEALHSRGDIEKARRVFAELAKRNHPVGLLNLGIIHQNESNYVAAADCFRKSCELGNDMARFQLGILKTRDIAGLQDYPEAFRLLKPLADRGVHEACWVVGTMCWGGQGVEKNRDEAVRLLRAAAKGKEGKYQLSYAAILMEKENRTEKETNDMMSALEQAAERGAASAAFQLGIFYAEGIPFVRVDDQKAYYYFLKSEMMSPNDESAFNLGFVLERQLESREVLDEMNSLPIFYWYKLAADRGKTDGLGRTGVLHFKVGNFDEARRHLSPRAKNGEPTAIVTLNALDIYEAEDRMDEDGRKRARGLLAEQYKNAKSGDLNAVQTLAKYFLLQGNDEDSVSYVKALRLLRHSARNGNVEALHMIGQFETTAADEWRRYSCTNVISALECYFAEFQFSKNADADYRKVQSILEGTGLKLTDWIFEYEGRQLHCPCVFSAIVVREPSPGKVEYYWLDLEERGNQVIHFPDAVKFLHHWYDNGYRMFAYRTKDGKIVMTGFPSVLVNGAYHGNDGKYNTPVPEFPYALAGFKKSHAAAIREFFPAFKRLLKENRRADISRLVRYPIELNVDTILEKKIQTPTEFLSAFDELFTSDFVQRIMQTPDDELFATKSGVVFGQGLLEIGPGGDEKGEAVKISRFEDPFIPSIISAKKSMK